MKKLAFIITTLLLTVLTGCATPKNISIYKEVPLEVNKGETFNFTISIHNEDSKEHELRSIDISNSFLQGIAILETSPIVKEEYDILGQHIFEFKKNLVKTSEAKIIFTAKAVKSGDFSGDLDVCIDGDTSCLYNSIRIIVN